MHFVLFPSARVALLLRPHVLAIHFVVPPGHAVIGRDHVGAGVHVAGHALARRDGASNWWRMGCPDSFFGMVGILVAVRPRLPNWRVAG